MQDEESEINNAFELWSNPTSSDSTVINDTDSDTREEDTPPQVLKKLPPKHTWFAVPEVINRQIGKG